MAQTRNPGTDRNRKAAQVPRLQTRLYRRRHHDSAIPRGRMHRFQHDIEGLRPITTTSTLARNFMNPWGSCSLVCKKSGASSGRARKPSTLTPQKTESLMAGLLSLTRLMRYPVNLERVSKNHCASARRCCALRIRSSHFRRINSQGQATISKMGGHFGRCGSRCPEVRPWEGVNSIWNSPIAGG